MSDEFDPVEAIREAASIVEGLGPDAGFPHNEERWVAAMLRGADQLEARTAAAEALVAAIFEPCPDDDESWDTDWWVAISDATKALKAALGAGE